MDFYFLKGKKYIIAKSIISGTQLIPLVKPGYRYNYSWTLIVGVIKKTPLSPKRILNVNLSYLLKYTDFFYYRFLIETKNLTQIWGFTGSV